jgi:hypothetical protein
MFGRVMGMPSNDAMELTLAAHLSMRRSSSPGVATHGLRMLCMRF